MEEIYRELQKLFGWTDAQAREAMCLEFAVEFDGLAAVTWVRDYIIKLRTNGQQIAFLSDMYWPSEQLRALLSSQGIAAAIDIVMVSCEERCGKTNGALFRRFLKKIQLPASSVCHLGNSLSADVGGAERIGIAVEHFQEGNLTAAETQILADNGSLWDQYLSGTSRQVRLDYDNIQGDEHRRMLTSVVTAVVMPVLMNFAFWIVRRAASRGIQRLIFVSRDGWLLEQCVTKALRNSRQTIGCKFIYGSRQAWHGAAVDPDHVEECTWLFEGADELSFERVLARLNLFRKSAAEYSEILGLDFDANRVLKAGDIVRISHGIRTNRSIRDEMRESRECVLAYLRQEDLDSQLDAAMVDLGWVGRLQGSLNGLLAQLGGKPVCGYYFGLVQGKHRIGGDDKESFLFDQRRPETSQYLAGGMLQLIESFCTQRQGTTIGYRRAESEKWEPVFRTEENEALVDWGIDHVHEVCRAYLARLPDDIIPEEDADSTLKEKTRHILSRFINNPNVAEARAWGAFPFEHEQTGGVVTRLAQPYPNMSQGLRIALRGPSGEKLGGYWRAGSHRLTPVLNRYALDIVRKAALEARRMRQFVGFSR